MPFTFSPFFLSLVGAALATFGWAVAVNAPRRCMGFAVLVGVAGQAAAQLAQQQGYSPTAAAFFGGLTVGILAEIGARWFRAPVTVFTITGFISLVPGTLAFRSIVEVLNSQYINGLVFAMRAVITGGAIAAGLGVPAALHQLWLRNTEARRNRGP